VAEDATVEVIGVHPVPDVPECFLIEVVIEGSTAVPDFGKFAQSIADRPRSEWQVAYDEQLLNDEGERVLTDVSLHPPSVWPRRARVAFYLHVLNLDRPLATPFGEVTLPRPSDVPARLAFLKYEAP
jgi:hypothetical protein